MREKEKARDRVLELRTLIEGYNKAYHKDQKSPVSDAEYDRLLKELEELEAAHPELQDPDSPSHNVGVDLSGDFPTAEHALPMMSLANTYNEEEIREFYDRVRKVLGESASEPPELIAELKYDGLAMSLIYEDGKLVRGLTRGDGRKGDVVTPNLAGITDIPKVLSPSHHLSGSPSHQLSISGVVEVRGEVYLNVSDLESINRLREEAEEETFANPRNAAAGSLKMKDPEAVASRPLRFIAYDLAQAPEMPESQSKAMEACQAWGFPPNKARRLCKTLDEALEFCRSWNQDRGGLPFEADGVVLKVNRRDQQKILGATAKSPRWAVAFKFTAEKAATKLLAIEIQVGRSGVLTPVAHLEPLPLGGVVVKRATLHNEDEIARKDIRVGEMVLVERSGGVIPKILGPASLPDQGEGSLPGSVPSPGLKKGHYYRAANRPPPFVFPVSCPSCGAATVREEGEAARRCPNLSCPAQLQRRLEYFVSKSAMDIEGLGPRHLETFISLGWIKRLSDIFDLNPARVAELEGFGEKSGEKLASSLESSKSRGLERLLAGLGLPHVGVTAAETLARHFGTLEALQDASLDALKAVPRLGDIVAAAIREFFDSAENKAELKRLAGKGLLLKAVTQARGGPLEGKSFVFTGTLSQPRAEAEAKVKSLGGRVSGSLSAKTSYLVVGAEPGSKAAKAEKLGVKVLTEAEFTQLTR